MDDNGAASKLERARQLYQQAVFGGDAGALAAGDRELDAVEADLALARGRILHARYMAEKHEDPRELPMFERAAELYQRLGDARGEAEALFWVGTFYQVLWGDHAAARPLLERSRDLATQAGDTLTVSYAVRHLGFADASAGRLEAAREQLAESVRLRREIGFMPGVAAGVLALAELAQESGDRGQALALIDEAAAIAQECGALAVLGWTEQARASL
jgi:tetratricopeptide (TPR) repeat protein